MQSLTTVGALLKQNLRALLTSCFGNDQQSIHNRSFQKAVVML